MSEFSARQKRIAVSRELALRRRVYPGWVASKRMKAAEANDQIAIMVAIEADYQALEEAEAQAKAQVVAALNPTLL